MCTLNGLLMLFFPPFLVFLLQVTIKTKGNNEEVVKGASVSFFPGNLTNPKRVTYPGEAGWCFQSFFFMCHP